MRFPTSGTSSDFKNCPPGTHISICNMVVDMGMQPGTGMYPTPKHQVYLRFEVPSERIEYEKDGKQLDGPQVIGQFFTASMHEKANLRKQLESWRGRRFTDDEAADFDVALVLGKPAMINVVEKESKDKTYSNISSISGLPKGFTAPKAENPLVFFSLDDGKGFDKLPEWLQKKINARIIPEQEPESQKHPEYNATAPDPSDPGISDDDLPDNMQDDSIPF